MNLAIVRRHSEAVQKPCRGRGIGTLHSGVDTHNTTDLAGLLQHGSIRRCNFENFSSDFLLKCFVLFRRFCGMAIAQNIASGGGAGGGRRVDKQAEFVVVGYAPSYEASEKVEAHAQQHNNPLATV